MTDGGGVRGSRFLRPALVVALAASILSTIVLALLNNSPGTPDACTNLDTARNLAAGRGFTSSMVQQLWVREAGVPHPESIRTPGMVFLLAGLFKLFGVTLVLPVLLNGAIVVAAALVLRATFRLLQAPGCGDAAALLLLLSANYEMQSLWNNNALMLCAALCLFVLARRREKRMGGPATAVSLAVLASIGFLLKPTFAVGAGLFSLLVLALDREESRRGKIRNVLLFLSICLVLVSPYCLRNYLLWKDPLYTHHSVYRLCTRYEFLGAETWHVVRFGQPTRMQEVVDLKGASWVLKAELNHLLRFGLHTLAMNPFVWALLAGALWSTSADRRTVLLAAVLCVGPIAEAEFYGAIERRYLWPIYPCLLFVVGLMMQAGSKNPSPRPRRLIAALLAGAFVAGLCGAAYSWTTAYRNGVTPTPSWKTPLERLPAAAVVLTSDPWGVTWWSERPSVISPIGSREDLEQVLRAYRPSHYLDLEGVQYRLPFLSRELKVVEKGAGWILYEILPAGD